MQSLSELYYDPYNPLEFMLNKPVAEDIEFYGDYNGDYSCSLIGTSDNRIVIDGQYNKRLNGTIHFLATGNYVDLIGLEVCYLDWSTRWTDGLVYPPIDLPTPISQNGAVQCHMPNLRVINCDIHDNRIGIGSWLSAHELYVYGCLLYYNGWYSPVLGGKWHGEGMYAQNNTGTKRVKHCVGHSNLDHNFISFGTTALAINFIVEENIWFSDQFSISGKLPSRNNHVINNAFYGTGCLIGFSNILHEDVHLTGNYIATHPDWYRNIWVMSPFETFELQNNIVIGNENSYTVYIEHPPEDWATWQIDNNAYYERVRTPNLPGKLFYVEGIGELTFDQWRSETGLDQNSTYTEGYAPEHQVLHLNEFKEDRAHLAVYNWTHANSIEVNLTGLPTGNYRIYNLQNKKNQWYDITYNGNPIELPMNIWTNGRPIGLNESVELSTFKEFGAFLIDGI